MMKRQFLLLAVACIGCRPPVSGASAILVPMTSSKAPSAARALDMGRPCEITVRPIQVARDTQCIITLARVLPEGEPLELVLTGAVTYHWRYAPDGRLLESPEYKYDHAGILAGSRKRKDERGSSESVQFDAQGRLVQLGDSRRLDYTPDGLTTGCFELVSKKWEKVVTYKWSDRKQYSVSWTYPDAQEFCVPGPDNVQLDERERVSGEAFTGCQNNYTAFTLRYKYKENGELDTIRVDCNGGEAAQTFELQMKYSCSHE